MVAHIRGVRLAIRFRRQHPGRVADGGDDGGDETAVHNAVSRRRGRSGSSSSHDNVVVGSSPGPARKRATASLRLLISMRNASWPCGRVDHVHGRGGHQSNHLLLQVERIQNIGGDAHHERALLHAAHDVLVLPASARHVVRVQRARELHRNSWGRIGERICDPGNADNSPPRSAAARPSPTRWRAPSRRDRRAASVSTRVDRCPTRWSRGRVDRPPTEARDMSASQSCAPPRDQPWGDRSGRSPRPPTFRPP